ncbi:zymogen granule membrane protein 16-like [Sphaeramia orbicularis]|uniref:Zymogen granule membrane protein 16-like n=1 Tax=Sphaeramia orbicularis TaxID=375764 RepID=A0A673AAH5_9TELE|nr:zymogen granule membrane protein 16-like [Sphaeramia orbicularis]XP_030004077.1 zymogen granule membrane protein 16-like [Sphaeramia orbicularis]XP_030004078.1 zymogen granule membrane protein 16-like [Sphaeramia orbicularis]XP_030004079.1 zymogen granule membrane protein 16-like [Sphaeramia orbicularis]
MQYLILFVLLPACILAAQTGSYSFSPPVGSGSGSSYTLSGEGRVTAVRVWENYNSVINGIQIRQGVVWSPVGGYTYGYLLEFELREDEAIIQISGKHSHYLYSLIFTTNKGRSFYAGQPLGHSFNMYPEHPQAELLFVSGRYHGHLTAFAAHWGVIESNADNSTGH